MKLQELELEYHKYLDRKALLEEELGRVEAELVQLQQELERDDETRSLARDVAELLRQRISERFSKFITEALQYIFESKMEFRTEIKTVRGLPAVRFYLNVNGVDVDPMDAQGGGVVDVLSLLLRIVFLEFRCKQAPLFLDEPFKHLSNNYVSKAMFFLEQYAEQEDRQIIIVSHKDVRCGKVFRLSKEGDKAKVEVIWEGKQ